MPGVPDGTVEVVVLDQRFSRGSNPIYMPFSATRVKSSTGIGRLRGPLPQRHQPPPPPPPPPPPDDPLLPLEAAVEAEAATE